MASCIGFDTVPSTHRLVTRVEGLAPPGVRRIVGIAGPPGAGKSTLAEAIVRMLGARAALVGLDGFHLSNAELDRLGRRQRKGAPDTFDAPGYLELLRRLRARPAGVVVYAPVYHRELGAALAADVGVPAEVDVVVTEGNYLLLDEPPWGEVRALVDDAWFLALDEQTRVRRLVSRHVRHGRTPAAAAAWVAGTDEPNAALVGPGALRADLVVRSEAPSGT